MATDNTLKTLLSKWLRSGVGSKMAASFADEKAQRVLKRAVLAVLLVGVVMYACSSSEHWKEEVQLSDGQIIVIERSLIHESGGGEWALNRSGTKPKEYRIEFEYPHRSGNKIEWRSAKASFHKWPEIPLFFNIEAGRPVMFSIVAVSTGCEIYSKYVYRDGAWKEEALPEIFEKRSTNLLLKGATKFVTLETKKKTNADSGYRKSIQQVGPTQQICG